MSTIQIERNWNTSVERHQELKWGAILIPQIERDLERDLESQ